mmetsp:Transcript_8886/g.16349  ORF Transcript_8886/g.16349 Transcript_8886/m.16349 type:complete len:393 (+) Transcript_8886:88-1266(+)
MTAAPNLAQQRALAYSPKPFGALSLFASIYVIRHLVRHPDKTKRLYHRLIGHMNVSIVVRSLAILWGNWAVPEGTPNVAGAVGTVQTCTVQGFLNIWTTVTVASYYASLSLCSFVSVKHKFKEEEYKWIEKWIHAFCVGIPLAFSVWMAATENINPLGSACYAAAYPKGCRTDPEVSCERGSEQIDFALIIIAITQFIIFCIIPPCVMLALYAMLDKSKPEYQPAGGMMKIIEDARKRMLRDVLLQISLYLLAFWFTYIFNLIQFVVQKITGESPYNFWIFANTINYSQGTILMLVYFQLQRMTNLGVRSLPETPVCQGRNRETDLQAIRSRASTRMIFDGVDTEQCKERASFSIFDGTPDQSSPWAKYIDQVSDDEVDVHEYRDDLVQECH